MLVTRNLQLPDGSKRMRYRVDNFGALEGLIAADSASDENIATEQRGRAASSPVFQKLVVLGPAPGRRVVDLIYCQETAFQCDSADH